VISCEHAGNEVPEDYRFLFSGKEEVLSTHRGWDPGAFHIAEFMAERLQCSLFHCSVTRLLIEMNRSIENPQLFSEFSVPLPDGEKLMLVEALYKPYRDGVEHAIRIADKPVVHLSIHSFTPEWNGKLREVDIGFLFDPRRKMESEICNAWKNNLMKILPEKKVRFNEPYQGTDDGFTTYLRTKFPDGDYAGIEVEINQKFVDTKEWLSIQSALVNTLPV
jgi:predicted N-formylglutamate amidohydrolase